jgi:apolipoprotein D and lipocalin family protein
MPRLPLFTNIGIACRENGNMILIKITLTILLSLFLMTWSGAMDKDRKPLAVVPSVDLGKYVGRWYEIARLPNRFEKKCVSSVTATYTLRPDGNIDVLNECKKASGELKKAKGKAKVVDKESNAKLKVTFFWPFYGDYWILDLGANYEYAVVGDESRKYLWILSRTPQIDEALYQKLLAKMANEGFDTSRIIKTPQP